ncbi:hypothetical protein DSO57_1015316 [Entomophthora muscae]|uniref:Uncharacterized protein n=1 Tax=Entomophthora muscae TaxID=34485 RepID=A0ACC2TG34_9FUNG|nr:hypothetical protein DSO57_1015316 [Entomophthora muscae]
MMSGSLANSCAFSNYMMDFLTDRFLPSHCPVTLSADLVWTGKKTFRDDIFAFAAKHTITEKKMLEKSKADMARSYVRKMKQGFIIHTPESISANIQCFSGEICVVEAVWTRNTGWTVSDTPTFVESVSSKGVFFHLESTHNTLRYQVTFFGNANISIWCQKLSWHTSYTIKAHTVLKKGFKSKSFRYKKTKLLSGNQSKPHVILGYVHRTDS